MKFFISQYVEVEKSFFVKSIIIVLSFFATQYFFGVSTGFFTIAPFFMLGSGSTPFLRTWNGRKFEYENDFLFGNPNSFFQDKKKGMVKYESKAVTPDVYKIQNSITLKDGHFVAQIKEIEPEESYIDYISLSRVVCLKNTELIVDSTFKKINAFKRKALEQLEGVVSQNVKLGNRDISAVAGDVKNIWKKMNDIDGYMLEPKKEFVEITGVLKNKNTPAYLLLRAHYRDWTAGEIFTALKDAGGYQKTSVFTKKPTFLKNLRLRAEEKLRSLR